MIIENKITCDTFASLNILSDQWIYKSISAMQRLSPLDFNLGLIFKISLCGDKSIFYVKPLEMEIPRKGKKANLPAIIE